MSSQTLATENRRKAFELSLVGLNAEEIAERLEVDKRSVQRYLAQGRELLLKETTESAAMLRAESSARLAEIRAAQWPKIQDPQAAAVLLRVEDRFAKLYGLDAPTRLEHMADIGTVHVLLGFAVSGALQLVGRIREAFEAGELTVEMIDDGQGAFVAEFEQRSRSELQPGSEAA